MGFKALLKPGLFCPELSEVVPRAQHCCVGVCEPGRPSEPGPERFPVAPSTFLGEKVSFHGTFCFPDCQVRLLLTSQFCLQFL